MPVAPQLEALDHLAKVEVGVSAHIEYAVEMVGHDLLGNDGHLRIDGADAVPFACHGQAQWREADAGSLRRALGRLGVADQLAQDGAAALHGHGDEIETL